MQDAFHAALRKRIDTEIANRSESLSMGRASTFEDYRHNVGVLEGLRAALELATEVEKKLYANNPLNGEK